MLNAKLHFGWDPVWCLPVTEKCLAFLFLHSISANLQIFLKLQQTSGKEVTDLQITKWFLKAISTTSPLAINTVCMMKGLLSQKCLWDLRLHKRAVKCVSLSSGSLVPGASGHIQLIVPIKLFPKDLWAPAVAKLPWNRKLYLHWCLKAWCSSIKGKNNTFRNCIFLNLLQTTSLV